MSRIFAISDLHIDYKENLSFVNSWSSSKYKKDVLIVAGDVTDKLPLLEDTLKSFIQKFSEVFYVPGNHEMWIRSDDTCYDSTTKFYNILTMCKHIGVHTEPAKVNVVGGESVWIVPLFGWYAKPEDDPVDTLYSKPPPHIVENVERYESMWMDNHNCKWSTMPGGQTVSRYFTDMNRAVVTRKYDAPVISFSHFLPRLDLVKALEYDLDMVTKERRRNGKGEIPRLQGGKPGFNFTRYAGSKELEKQVRELNSMIHVFGHQHRNRDRVIDGIRYVSHCLGNLSEQKEGWTWGIRDWRGPKQIWPEVKS